METSRTPNTGSSAISAIQDILPATQSEKKRSKNLYRLRFDE